MEPSVAGKKIFPKGPFCTVRPQEAVWDDSLDRVGYSAKPTMVSLAGHDNRGTKATYDIIECYILNICIDRGYSDNA